MLIAPIQQRLPLICLSSSRQWFEQRGAFRIGDAPGDDPAAENINDDGPPLRRTTVAGEDLFFELALEDLTRVADLFELIFERTDGVDGCGRPVGYPPGALAVQIGRPTATRAVGLANGAYPIAIVIPCSSGDRRKGLIDRLWRGPRP